MEIINQEPFFLLCAADIERLPAGIENAYPLSVCQTFVHDTILPRNRMRITSRHINLVFDMTKLTEVVNYLTHCHPMLRTSFDINNYNEPLQLVHRDVDVSISLDKVQDSLLSMHEVVKLVGNDIGTWKWQHAPLWSIHVQLLGANKWKLNLIETFLDRQSVLILMNELYRYYHTLIDGRLLPDSPPITYYQTLVATERRMTMSEKTQLFWGKNRSQMSETLVMKNVDKLYANIGGTLRKAVITITSETRDVLIEMARKNNTGLEILLFAAHCKVVSLLSGQATITTGICTDLRHTSDNEQAKIGNFVRVLPFAITLGVQETWNDIASRVQEAFDALHELEKFSLEELYDINKLFDFNFAYNEHADTSYSLNDIEETVIIEDSYDSNSLIIRFISGSMIDGIDDLKCFIEYRDDLITKEQVIAFGDYYSRILQAVGREKETFHTSSDWLPYDDKQLLTKWNNTVREFPLKNNLAQLFEEQVQKTPDQIACINKNEQLTYQQLNERSNQLARYLQKLGVGPEILVGICMERSNLMLIGLLGILKAGGGYVPLDPKYPKDRLCFMLDDAKVELILTDTIISKQLSFEDRRMIQLDDEWSIIATFEYSNMECQTKSSNVAYLVFTSGSTGFPKAAEIEHRSVIELMYWAKDEFGIDTLAGVLASSSICFDMSIFELYVPLSWGGTVIIVDDILKLQNTQPIVEISLLSTVPSALCTLAELGWVPTNTRAALLAGEPLSRQMTKRIFAATKLEKIWNAYGLSEDTTYTTVSLIKRGFEGPVTIGRPIANRQLYVLDEYQQMTPIGVVGELYVAGNGLARGYINRPDLTKERFLTNSFDTNTETRMYRTGDLVRYRPDGTLEYIGRKDHQLKLRGHRIELGEIEMTLATHIAVEQCAVVCREENGDKRLVAYVVTRKHTTDVSPLQLKEHLRVKLPEWMVPASIVWLEKLPTTSHGKLNRQALPAPERCLWPSTTD